MWLLVGLGNPGDEHAKNRHNIGFMAIDAIAGKAGFPAFRGKFQGEIAEGRLGGGKAALLKPQTYMNESGQSVGKAAKFYKISPERIVVFHDEIDLKNETIRIKKGGGNAGHNGLRSIQDHLGTPDFWRVRIGVSHPGDKGRVSGHVLSDFSKADREWVAVLLEVLADHAETIIKCGPERYGKNAADHLRRHLSEERNRNGF